MGGLPLGYTQKAGPGTSSWPHFAQPATLRLDSQACPAKRLCLTLNSQILTSYPHASIRSRAMPSLLELPVPGCTAEDRGSFCIDGGRSPLPPRNHLIFLGRFLNLCTEAFMPALNMRSECPSPSGPSINIASRDHTKILWEVDVVNKPTYQHVHEAGQDEVPSIRPLPWGELGGDLLWFWESRGVLFL